MWSCAHPHFCIFDIIFAYKRMDVFLDGLAAKFQHTKELLIGLEAVRRAAVLTEHFYENRQHVSKSVKRDSSPVTRTHVHACI